MLLAMRPRWARCCRLERPACTSSRCVRACACQCVCARVCCLTVSLTQPLALLSTRPSHPHDITPPATPAPLVGGGHRSSAGGRPLPRRDGSGSARRRQPAARTGRGAPARAAARLCQLPGARALQRHARGGLHHAVLPLHEAPAHQPVPAGELVAGGGGARRAAPPPRQPCLRAAADRHARLHRHATRGAPLHAHTHTHTHTRARARRRTATAASPRAAPAATLCAWPPASASSAATAGSPRRRCCERGARRKLPVSSAGGESQGRAMAAPARPPHTCTPPP
jgi:hypothetical protein